MKTPADIEKTVNDLSRRFSEHLSKHFLKHLSGHPPHSIILISINEQELYLIEDKKIVETYPISSAKNGTGNLSGSYQTPLGLHYISEKIGDNAKLGSIFKARVDTKKIATILHNPDETSNDDNITSRILWLSGLEEGLNKGGNIDSHERYIYIHGTDEEGRLGQAVSHGCIRMSNQNIIDLFNRVTVGTLISIEDL